MVPADNLEYAYAKACALLPLSRLPSASTNPQDFDSLTSLANALFPEKSHPSEEVSRLSVWLQDEVDRRAWEDGFRILRAFREPPPLLLGFLRVYEVRWLKSAIATIVLKAPAPPWRGPAGSDLDFVAYPDIAAITRATPFRGLFSDLSSAQLLNFSVALDLRFFSYLKNACDGLSEEDGALALIRWEEAATAALLALRLRLLFGRTGNPAQTHFAAHEFEAARQAFSLPTDRREAWAQWEFFDLLNREDSANWNPDPLIFESNLQQRLHKKALTIFRSQPGSLEALYGYFRLRECEAVLLKAFIEAVERRRL